MRNLFRMSVFCIALTAGVANAAEYLVRFEKIGPEQERFLSQHGGKLDLVSEPGRLFKWTTDHEQAMQVATWDRSVKYVQPNYTIRLLQNPSVLELRKAILKAARRESPRGDFIDDIGDWIFGDEQQQPDQQQPDPDQGDDDGGGGGGGFPGLPGIFDWIFGGGGGSQGDNPAIKPVPTEQAGTDPMLSHDWGILSIGSPARWSKSNSGKDIIVAVTDSGVDYNHQDLIANMWRNPKEVPDDGVDNDKNGKVDDIVGWDFVTNDNKPYDLTVDTFSMIFGGGNPGHGTHVSGVIAATYNNSLGVAGVAHRAKIMALRFIGEKGQGSTESAIQAIDYAVENGAKVINASWGGEKGDEDDTALREAIERAEKKGVIFCAAAGNGRADAKGGAAGFNNDADSKPMIPATLDIPNIVSVAAIDSKDQLGTFSNWGPRSVKLGAPGVKILSTVPGNRYQDTVIDMPGLGTAHWDGTSMATPHVAGAMALVWSDHQNWTYQQVIDEVMKATKPIPALNGKVVTGGKLDLSDLQ